MTKIRQIHPAYWTQGLVDRLRTETDMRNTAMYAPKGALVDPATGDYYTPTIGSLINDRWLSLIDYYRLYPDIEGVIPTPGRTRSVKGKDYEALLANATDIEIAVYTWLYNKGIPFDFQSWIIGGFDRQLGDALVDFVLPEQKTLLRVQGAYWHTGVEVEAKDIVQRARLEAMGYTVIDLQEKDIHDRLESTMDLALQGQEQPK